ncbi:WG repeat-containing protein [Porifericola rhodea]|uniref:tetratricopeptide repeat protein n=1 Tax=Porifericola rhodea TaxID=930972 RepID=UPI00266667D6|nr:WG repeat-containing protein [Porifericola rhodea]WKN30294.1 WG repeat-containing protein [Porifericola rhodea]
MKKKLLLVPFIFFLFYSCNSSKQALSLINKQKYQAAQAKLDKQIAKDSLNADTYYVYSLLYTDTAFYAYNIDSSFFFINQAILDFEKTDLKNREKLQASLGLDSVSLLLQKERNDSLAFQRAQEIHTVQAYQDFLDTHTKAQQTTEATKLRNQLAYQAASEMDTYEAYKSFMEAYPNAEEYALAQERYNTLAFRVTTRTGDLQSYLSFLNAFPDSPFRSQAEEYILQISTASNSFQSYADFINSYPNSPHAALALNLLYHQYKEKHSAEAFFQNYQDLPLIDSLKEAYAVAQHILAPIFENQHYGLLNKEAEFVIPKAYDFIPPQYLCEGVQDEVIHLAKKENDSLIHSILTKDAQLIHQYQLAAINTDGAGSLYTQKHYLLPSGLMLLQNEAGKYRLMHQSGTSIYPASGEFTLDTLSFVKTMSEENSAYETGQFQFIKIQENAQWGLISLTGKELLSTEYEEIEDYGHFIVLTKNGKMAVSSRDKIIEAANQKPLELSFLYEDVALIDNRHIVAYTDKYETAINFNLETEVPLEDHNIIRIINDSDPQNQKWLLKRNKSKTFVRNDSLFNTTQAVYYIYDKQNNTPENTYEKAYFNDRWLALQDNKGFHFFDFQLAQEGTLYDSVKLVGESFALLFEEHENASDSVKVKFKGGGLLSLVSPERINFLLLKQTHTLSRTSEEYLLIAPRSGPKEVWNAYGKRVLEGSFSDVQLMPQGLFVVEERRNKGLIDSLGNELVPSRYQSISNFKDNTVALFQNRKFGTYRVDSKTLISPRYEAVLQPYGQPIFHQQDSTTTELFIAKQKGSLGIINQNNIELTDFAYDAIHYWNDTSALVRVDEEWSIISFSRKEQFDKEKEYERYSEILDFEVIEKTEEEAVLKIYKKSGYGVLSNKKGELLSPTYDDIRLFGSLKDVNSIYYSEKYVPEADLYIVIHLDKQGNIIKRQALTQEQYDLVFCED